jgi:hypothetical protein
MRPSLFIAALLAAAGTFGTFTSAQAQSFGIYVGPSYPSSYDRPYRSRGYYRDNDERGYRRDHDGRDYSSRGGCGTYHYWNGERCVDKRAEH